MVKRWTKGFALVELLIVMIDVGYRLRKTDRTDAPVDGAGTNHGSSTAE